MALHIFQRKHKHLHLGPTQVKCRVLICIIFYAIEFGNAGIQFIAFLKMKKFIE